MKWIQANWPAPKSIRALTTTRQGGFSSPPFAGLNLATHVGDDLSCVEQNRRLLVEQLNLPTEPNWLNQVHGTTLIEANKNGSELMLADGCWTDKVEQVCAVLTADCLPLLLCHETQPWVAAVHCGWRGIADGIIEQATSTAPPGNLMAWLGPAIGPTAFEVGLDVREQFLQRYSKLDTVFISYKDRWRLDLYQAVTLLLAKEGVQKVYGGEYCTYSDEAMFFSYRRDGQCGRIASLIWIENSVDAG